MKAVIQTPTNGLQNSLDFYQKLGFQLISEEKNPCFSDGKLLIEVNPNRFARAGVKLYASDWAKEVEELKKLVNITEIEDGFLFITNNTWVFLIEREEATPDLPNEPSVLGNCAGLSLETPDMAKDQQVWEALGFKKTMGDVSQGWLALSHPSGFGVSLMKIMACPHLFFNPSISYFNGKENLAVIDKIRKLGIPIAEEITYFNKEGIADNIIIRDPGGLGFFIFSD